MSLLNINVLRSLSNWCSNNKTRQEFIKTQRNNICHSILRRHRFCPSDVTFEPIWPKIPRHDASATGNLFWSLHDDSWKQSYKHTKLQGNQKQYVNISQQNANLPGNLSAFQTMMVLSMLHDAR